jgi:hypothetical protein
MVSGRPSCSSCRDFGTFSLTPGERVCNIMNGTECLCPRNG